MGRFIRTKDGKLYDVINYGIDTAGTCDQKSIIEKNGKYYFEDWQFVCDPEIDSHSEYTEIDVVKASDEIEDIVDEIKDIEVGKAAFINGKIVAIYSKFDGTEFEWDMLSNYVTAK